VPHVGKGAWHGMNNATMSTLHRTGEGREKEAVGHKQGTSHACTDTKVHEVRVHPAPPRGITLRPEYWESAGKEGEDSQSFQFLELSLQ
jgi:hypothetical protein